VNPVVVLFALEREATPFRKRKTPAKILISGVGPTAARRATLFALEAWSPRQVIAAGFCGGLAPHLVVGDIVQSPRILSVNEVVGDPAEKRRLSATHDAVDMESAAIEQICQQRGVPFLAVRAVSDTYDTALSPELLRLISGGRVSVWRVLRALVGKPSLLREFLRLWRATSLAANQLAEALVPLVEEPSPIR
jgi:adenosylhomocysteine nucleosidase